VAIQEPGALDDPLACFVASFRRQCTENFGLEMGARLEDVAFAIHAHPTQSEAFQEAVLKGAGDAAAHLRREIASASTSINHCIGVDSCRTSVLKCFAMASSELVTMLRRSLTKLGYSERIID